MLSHQLVEEYISQYDNADLPDCITNASSETVHLLKVFSNQLTSLTNVFLYYQHQKNPFHS